MMNCFATALASIFLVMACIGCIYIPEASPVYRSSDLGHTAASPLQIGVADRAAVVARWGKPSYRSQHDLAFGYLFATKVGTNSGLLMGPCMPYVGVCDADVDDDVWLEFDNRGVLKRYEKHLMKRKWWRGYPDQVVWKEFAESIQDKPLGLVDNDLR